MRTFCWGVTELRLNANTFSRFTVSLLSNDGLGPRSAHLGDHGYG